MKKQLLGTTTLVAAGLLMGQGAYAAEPMSLSTGGYLQSAFSMADDDDSAGVGATVHDNTISTEGEIQFTATGELDNGISVRARVEYEAVPGATSTVDERYIRFSGGFGSFTMGQDDAAHYAMAYQAPSGSWQMGLNSPTFGADFLFLSDQVLDKPARKVSHVAKSGRLDRCVNIAYDQFIGPNFALEPGFVTGNSCHGNHIVKPLWDVITIYPTCPG